MLAAQASVQARLQIWWWVTDISSLWMTEEQEQEANSGWMVQHLTPTLWSTFKTSEIRSAHLLGQHSLLMGTEMNRKRTESQNSSNWWPSGRCMPCYLCVLKSAWQCTWTEATQNNSVNSQTCRSCTACTPGTLSMLRWRSDMEMCGGVACSSNIPCLDTWRATSGPSQSRSNSRSKREHRPLTQEAWPVERMWQVIEPSLVKTSQDPGKAWGCSPQSHAGTLGWTPAGPHCWSEPEWPLQERTAAGRRASGGTPPCDGRICCPKNCLNCFDLNESSSKTWHVTGSTASLPLGFKPWVQHLVFLNASWLSHGLP